MPRSSVSSQLLWHHFYLPKCCWSNPFKTSITPHHLPTPTCNASPTLGSPCHRLCCPSQCPTFSHSICRSPYCSQATHTQLPALVSTKYTLLLDTARTGSPASFRSFSQYAAASVRLFPTASSEEEPLSLSQSRISPFTFMHMWTCSIDTLHKEETHLVALQAFHCVSEWVSNTKRQAVEATENFCFLVFLFIICINSYETKQSGTYSTSTYLKQQHFFVSCQRYKSKSRKQSKNSSDLFY